MAGTALPGAGREYFASVEGVSRNKGRPEVGWASHFSVSSDRSLRHAPVAVLVSSPTDTAERSWKNSREVASWALLAKRSVSPRVTALSAGEASFNNDSKRNCCGSATVWLFICTAQRAAEVRESGLYGCGSRAFWFSPPIHHATLPFWRSTATGVGCKWISSLSRPAPLPSVPLPTRVTLPAVSVVSGKVAASLRLADVSQATKRFCFSEL